MNDVVGTEELAELVALDAVHYSGLEIDQHGPRHIFACTSHS